jgi:hypothetical protein
MARRAKTTAVDANSAAYDDMHAKWGKIDDLLGGTQAMRDAGETWLPKMELEGQTQYERRLADSFLFNAYADTARKVTAKPFTKPIVVENNDKLPEQLQLIMDDADRAGSNLTQLAKDLFWIGFHRGFFHILVDYPQTATEDGEKRTKDEEQRSGQRPVLIPLWPDDVFAWQTRKGDNGETVLSQVRIYETATEPGGDADPFGEVAVERVRVLTEDSWQLWEKRGNDKEFVMASEGTHTLGRVPLITGYFEQTDFMEADPPMEDLAWLNIEHWQSSSDQRNILRFARTGVWWQKGVSEEEAAALAIGPSAHAWSTNEGADMKVVEHSGASIGAGAEDLTKLEERMQLMGLRPFIQQARNATATSETINEARGETEIQAWIRAVEQALMAAYRMAGDWIKQEIPDDFKVDIATQFALSLRAVQDANVIIEARKLKDIDQRTAIIELKRRRILGEDVDVDEVIAATEAEGPSPAAGGPPFGGAGDDEDEDGDEADED